MAKRKASKKKTGSAKRSSITTPKPKKAKNKAPAKAPMKARRAPKKAKAKLRPKPAASPRPPVARPAPKPRTKPAPASVRELGMAATTTLESAELEGTETSALAALRDKLTALERLGQELRARRTGTAADDDEINPNLEALAEAKQTVEARIAVAETGTLDPPSASDVEKLRTAIRDSEDAIARSVAVNQLVRAMTALIRTLE